MISVESDIDDEIPLRLVSLAKEMCGCEFSERVEIEGHTHM